MILETDFDTLSDHATRDEVIDLIEALGKGSYSIARLLHEDEVFMQTSYLAAADQFGLDYRDGDASRHFEVTVPTADLVLSVFLSYLAEDDKWRSMVEWKRDTHYEQ